MTTTKSNVAHITDISKFRPVQITILYFFTTWHEPCQHLSTVFQELSTKYPKLNFYQIDAEEMEDLSIKFDIESVPTFIVLNGEEEIDRYQGQNAPVLTQLIQKHSNVKQVPVAAPIKKQSLETLVQSHPIMIFIKGTPTTPKCGFSRQSIDLLNELNVAYGSFDILADEDVRQGLKVFSDWPTFPQST
jgi:thiol-disulfide isomerase/thioredoxin